MIRSLDSFQDVLKNNAIPFAVNASTVRLSTMRAGGFCSVLVTPTDQDMLCFVLTEVRKNGIPHAVIGGGSNLLLDDDLFEGAIIRTSQIKGKFEAEESIVCSCGESLAAVDGFMTIRGYRGIPELCGIPGTVGGAVYGNAGAFGKEIADVLLECVCYAPSKGGKVTLSIKDIAPSYRRTCLSECDLVILSAKLRCDAATTSDICDLRKLYCDRRRATQPTGVPSLGSYFKRCNGVGAGYYVDKAGLKGLSVGDASVSTKHAGFIVNNGNARCRDVRDLAERIKRTVNDSLGVILEEEIRHLYEVVRR